MSLYAMLSGFSVANSCKTSSHQCPLPPRLDWMKKEREAHLLDDTLVSVSCVPAIRRAPMRLLSSNFSFRYADVAA